PVFSGASEVVWFSEKEIPGNLIINEDSAQSVYLRGPAVHRYLSQAQNFNRLYCLVVSFNDPNASAKRQLRARALPISFNNFSQGSVERLLRIDITQKTDNQESCSGSAYAFVAQEKEPSLSTLVLGSAQSAFAPPELCPNC